MALLAAALVGVNLVGLKGLVGLSLFTMSHAEATASVGDLVASGGLWHYLFYRVPFVAVYASAFAVLAMLLGKASGVCPRAPSGGSPPSTWAATS